MAGEFTLPDGRRATPAFQLHGRALSRSALRARCAWRRRSAFRPPTIRRIAAELAHAAFEEEITLDMPWTDWAGRRHDKMIGRPVAMHAMRGISAHSNGFHTCRAIHLLQMLLGSIDCPGGFRYKPPFPRPIPPPVKPAGDAPAGHVARAAPLLDFPRARRSAGRGGRHAAAHRQGVIAGRRRSPPMA